MLIFFVFVNLSIHTYSSLYSILKQQLELKVPGGGKENRTPDPLLARQVLSQLSYTPTYSEIPKAKKLSGGLKWTRTTDLTLIRRVL